MIIDEEVYLEHWGVKGMKWGVRKDRVGSGQGATKTSTSNKKDSKRLPDEYLKAALFGATFVSNQLIKKGTRNLQLGSLSPTQTALVIQGGIIVSGMLIRKGAHYFDSGRRDAKRSGKAPFKKNESLKRKMSTTELSKKVVKPINSDYPAPGTKQNCRRATLAYEMRRRGHDVKATKSTFAAGQGTSGIRNVTNAKFREHETRWGEKKIRFPSRISNEPIVKAKSIFSELSKNPNGARGELTVAWKMGGGHSVAWEIVNNKPVIFDTQNGKIYDSPSSLNKLSPVIKSASQTRLDNKVLNDKILRRWVTNV